MISKNHIVLKWILYLTAVHSFFVGIGLIFITDELRQLLGFMPSNEQFFQTQGGVFHIIMSIAYFLGAYNYTKYRVLICFSIIVKLCATIFLTTYYITINSSLLILSSALSDFLMFLLILFYYNKTKKEQIKNN